MKNTGRVQLLFGPYHAPALKPGERATCPYRDCDVVITSWTVARISWPRGRPVDVPRTHPSLLVDEELARAVRCESAAAVMQWWGISGSVVRRWWRARSMCPARSQKLRRERD
jgi:hypothetical protein